MTVAAALRLTEERLAAAGVETPNVDAELLVAHVLGVSRSQLHAEREREVPDGLNELVERRTRREPLAYVLGEWGFRHLTLKTDARALVPRPETEIVVERCLALLAGESAPRVLDLGTGSGAIALAIADEHPGARVTAVDSSPEALALARENSEALDLAIELHEAGLEAAEEGWDLVVSNPPYVAASEWDSLQPEIRDWEPRAALVGEGLHEEIARRAHTLRLVLEVGDEQAESVAAALDSLGYSNVTITSDLTDRERVVEGIR
ncbi:MAG: peptide chain release factor N(5)-glutamine methyltransferase [Actinobacteria bacterium]|nr:peptide chain release factor N(5)-glutamine methyltransferase [Actinomycetota bacterium]